MCIVCTSRIDHSSIDRLDVTIKSCDRMGAILAPSWSMVMGVKKGQITPERYTELYTNMMRERYQHNKQPFLDILALKRVVLCCYCPAGDFCHRRLAVSILEKIAKANGLPFVRGGEVK